MCCDRSTEYWRGKNIRTIRKRRGRIDRLRLDGERSVPNVGREAFSCTGQEQDTQAVGIGTAVEFEEIRIERHRRGQQFVGEKETRFVNFTSACRMRKKDSC